MLIQQRPLGHVCRLQIVEQLAADDRQSRCQVQATQRCQPASRAWQPDGSVGLSLPAAGNQAGRFFAEGGHVVFAAIGASRASKDYAGSIEEAVMTGRTLTPTPAATDRRRPPTVRLAAHLPAPLRSALSPGIRASRDVSLAAKATCRYPAAAA
jgi:hypothetical protein